MNLRKFVTKVAVKPYGDNLAEFCSLSLYLLEVIVCICDLILCRVRLIDTVS